MFGLMRFKGSLLSVSDADNALRVVPGWYFTYAETGSVVMHARGGRV